MKKEEKEVEEKKKGKKGLIITLSILLGIIFIAAIVFLILYLKKPKYEIKIDTDGHKIKKDIVIKDNIIKALPELELDDDEELVAWVNKDNEAMRPNLGLIRDDRIRPIIEPSNRETVTLKFVTGTSEKIPDIKITKGSEMIFPVKPTHKGWTFICWNDKNGVIALVGKKIYEDTTFYANWFKSNKKEVTISFDTGTSEKIKSITLMQGENLIFPEPTVAKKDSKFAGWMDKDGNVLTSDYIVNEDIKLTAKWVPNYSCPDNCIPNADGKTCVRDLVKEPIRKKVCEGTEWRGYCLDFNKKESGAIRQCAAMGNDASDEVWYTEGGEDWCVKKMPWVEELTCPDGYEIAEDKCYKPETVDCTKN